MPGHTCKKLFLIKVHWEDDDRDVEMEIEGEVKNAAPEISLHAMAGFQEPKTMCMW